MTTTTNETHSHKRAQRSLGWHACLDQPADRVGVGIVVVVVVVVFVFVVVVIVVDDVGSA